MICDKLMKTLTDDVIQMRLKCNFLEIKWPFENYKTTRPNIITSISIWKSQKYHILRLYYHDINLKFIETQQNLRVYIKIRQSEMNNINISLTYNVPHFF